MTKTQLRKIYEEQNYFLHGEEGSITISRKNFWRFFELTWQKACEEGHIEERRSMRERVKQSVKLHEILESSGVELPNFP